MTRVTPCLLLPGCIRRFLLCAVQGPAFEADACTLQGAPLVWVHRLLAGRSAAARCLWRSAVSRAR